jgi:uncharacterized protein with PQ loop repeat
VRVDATLCANAHQRTGQTRGDAQQPPAAAPARGTRLARLRRVSADVIGWGSSLVLLLTISKQIWQQWQARDTEGVSPWLFIGQMAASIGFTTYSVLVGNWIFVVTNVVLAASAVVGLVVLMLHKRGGRK